MTISDLIRNLEKAKENHGDVVVLIKNEPDQKRSYNSIHVVDTIDCDIIMKNGKEVLERSKSIILR